MTETGPTEGQEASEDDTTELTYSVYDVEEESDETAGDDDPEGGEEGAM